MSNIEAVKHSVVIALACPLPEGKIQQVLPLKFFFHSEQEWKTYIHNMYGNEIVFKSSELTLEKIYAKEAQWICGHCSKDKKSLHKECLRTSGNLMEFMKARIWSDPSLQELLKYKPF